MTTGGYWMAVTIALVVFLASYAHLGRHGDTPIAGMTATLSLLSLFALAWVFSAR